MCYVKALFLIVINLFNFSCDGETGYDTQSRIKLELKYIYPKKADDVPINAAIVISFNMPVDKTSVSSESIQVISADDTRLDSTWEVMGNLVIVKPAQGKYMAVNTNYSIHIVGVTNQFGRKLKVLNATAFHTGNSIDESGPVALGATAKEETNEIVINFDEIVKHWNIKDNAVEVYDITNDKTVTGKVIGVEHSGLVRFIPDGVLSLDSKYRITVTGSAGICDMIGNEYRGEDIVFELFMIPSFDTTPPYIRYVYTDIDNKTLTFYLSEKFDKAYLDTCNPNNTYKPYGICALAFNGPITEPLMPIKVTLSDDHESFTIIFTDLTSRPNFQGQEIKIRITQNVFFDLAGNQIIENSNPNFSKQENILIYHWIVPK